MVPDKLKYWFFFFTPILMISGCNKEIFTGPETSVTKELKPFNEIIINSIFDIQLGNADTFLIELIGNEKIIKNIEYGISDGVLYLSDNNSGQWLPDYPHVTLNISFPDLERMTSEAPVKVFTNDTLHLKSFSFRSYGLLSEIDLVIKSDRFFLSTSSADFGYYKISGKSAHSDIRVYGSGQVDASALITDFSRVRNYSIGDCHVYVTKHLVAMLGHYGNIYYRGSPERITIERKESRGRLIEVNSDN